MLSVSITTSGSLPSPNSKKSEYLLFYCKNVSIFTLFEWIAQCILGYWIGWDDQELPRQASSGKWFVWFAIIYDFKSKNVWYSKCCLTMPIKHTSRWCSLDDATLFNVLFSLGQNWSFLILLNWMANSLK